MDIHDHVEMGLKEALEGIFEIKMQIKILDEEVATAKEKLATIEEKMAAFKHKYWD